MQSLYLLILLFFIILIITPLGFRVKVFYSIKSNRGAVSIKLWCFWIKKIKLIFKGNKIYVLEKHNNSEIEIELGEPQLRFLQFFNDEVKDKVKLRSVYAFMRVGVDNPFYAALLSSLSQDVVLGVFAYIKNKMQLAHFNLKAYTSFTEFNYIIAFNVRLSLSILDVLYSFVMSILRTSSDRAIERKMGAN